MTQYELYVIEKQSAKCWIEAEVSCAIGCILLAGLFALSVIGL